MTVTGLLCSRIMGLFSPPSGGGVGDGGKAVATGRGGGGGGDGGVSVKMGCKSWYEDSPLASSAESAPPVQTRSDTTDRRFMHSGRQDSFISTDNKKTTLRSEGA